MRSQLFQWLLTTSLVTTTIVGTVQLASAQPDVRDHRRDKERGAALGKEQAPERRSAHSVMNSVRLRTDTRVQRSFQPI